MWQLIFLAPAVTGTLFLLGASCLAALIIHPIAGQVVFFGLLVSAFLLPERHPRLTDILFAIRTFSFVLTLLALLLVRSLHLYPIEMVVMIIVSAAVGIGAQLRIRGLERLR